MEFIPLEKYSKPGLKTKRKTRAEEPVKATPEVKKSRQDDEKKSLSKGKPRPQPKIIEKKTVKNKYRETLALKKEKKIRVKKKARKDEEEEEEEDDKNEDVEFEDDKNEDEEFEDDKNDDVEFEEKKNDKADNENDSKETDEKEENTEEEAFKKKCKELDEKKKNRLFLKLKKKIYSEAEIKQLHPDIRSVIFPRKKRSRWCWAVFASEERADKAMKQLMKNKEILVNKPNPHDKVIMKRKEKLKTVLRKKEARKKLQKMWV